MTSLFHEREQSNSPLRRNQNGFSALELLFVIAAVGLLSVLAVSSILHGSESSKRLHCLRNVRAMAQASLMYAENDSQGRLIGYSTTSTASSGDDLAWLHGFGPNYPQGLISDLKTFACPSTRNNIRTNLVSIPTSRPGVVLADLLDNAASPTGGNGHSYEVSSTHRNGVRKTPRTVLEYVNQTPAFLGVTPGPSRTFLFFDAMDSSQVFDPGAINDYPGAGYNHGMDGANVGFADGHAEWIGVGDWNYRRALSSDFPNQLTPFE